MVAGMCAIEASRCVLTELTLVHARQIMLACNAQYFAGNCLRYSQSGCDMVSVTFPCPGCMGT
eukprot:15072331-Ditylum_brightwellii.AAC.1